MSPPSAVLAGSGLLFIALDIGAFAHTLVQLREVSETPEDASSWAAIPLDIRLPSLAFAAMVTALFLLAGALGRHHKAQATVASIAFLAASAGLVHGLLHPNQHMGWLVLRALVVLAGLGIYLQAAYRKRQTKSSSGAA